MKKYIYAVLLALIFIFVSCTITPEESEEPELNIAVTKISSPVISDVITTHSESNPSISVLWEPVDKATFYVFEYESANEYLSGKTTFSEYVTNSNSFTFPSSAFPDSSDTRFVFRVRAAYKPSSTRSIIYSGYSDTEEAAVVNTFTITPIIQDNVLTLYSSFPKIKSVLAGGNIVQPEVKYYDVTDGNETALESNTLTLSSAETRIIKGVLIVDGEEVTTREITVKTATDYYPQRLTSLEASTNKESIILNWSANAVNKGLEEYDTKMRFYIERRERESSTYSTLVDKDGNTIYVEGSIDGGSFSYSDTSAEEGKDYIYRVITQYVLKTDDNEIEYEEKKDKSLESNAAYIADKTVKSFIIAPLSGFDGDPVTKGDADYSVSLDWSSYHELREGYVYEVTRWDFDLITFVDGAPTDSTPEEKKYSVVYSGRDTSAVDNFTLSQEENKSSHSYTYFIQIKKADGSSDNPFTQAKKKDEDGSLVEGIIKTNPSVKEINFIKSFSGESHLSERINLTWEYNEDAIKSAGLDTACVNVHILKKAASESLYSDIATADGTSYPDTRVESGVTYSYILVPYYSDESSPYYGKQRADSDNQVYASILSDVENVSATINKSSSEILVTWDKTDNAAGYIVYSRVKGTTDWSKAGTTTETKMTLSESFTPGVRYEITVSPVDKNGESRKTETNIVEGEILGPVSNLKATGESDIQSDSIILSWDVTENATSYVITVYDSKESTDSIYSETVLAARGTTYTFSASSEAVKAYSTTRPYALSKEYYFTVSPMVNSVKADESSVRTKGYWVMPPKNITATKASYRDLITISWDKVEGADKYVIYYRKHGSSDDWKYLNNVSSSATSINYLNSTEKCDFTVSTMIDNVEGITQTYFEQDSNYGYPLIAPEMVTCADNGNGFFKLSFKEVTGATSYKIIFEDSSWELNVSDISTTPLTSVSAYKADIDANGLISYYFPRPAVSNKVSFTASVASTNKNAAISSKNTTSYNSATVTYRSLSNDELIRLAFNNLHEIFLAADKKFESDWWRPSQKTATLSNGFTAATCGDETYHPSKLTYTIDNYGYMDLQNYSQYGNIITTHVSSSETRITCCAKENITWGYANSDNKLYRISGTIEIQLPYTHGDVTIKFTDFNVYTNTGTAVINGITYTDLSGYTKLL